jgi:hypothetical protein
MGSTQKKPTLYLLTVTSALLGFGFAGCAFDNEDQAPKAASTPPADTVQVVNNSPPPPAAPPPTGVVYAPTRPPPNRTEYLPSTKPSADARWIGGHYVWQGNDWQWIDGHYEAPPFPGATYSPGYYSYKGPYGYRWVGGYWK